MKEFLNFPFQLFLMEELLDCILFSIFNGLPETYTHTPKGLAQVISYQSSFLFTNPFTYVYAFSMAVPSDYTSFQKLTLEPSFILESIHLSIHPPSRNIQLVLFHIYWI